MKKEQKLKERDKMCHSPIALNELNKKENKSFELVRINSLKKDSKIGYSSFIFNK